MATRRQRQAGKKQRRNEADLPRSGAGRGGPLDRLPEAYERIKPSLVAIANVRGFDPERLKRREAFPPIIGTGFVVDPSGLVVTNAHVVDAIGEAQDEAPETPIINAFSLIHDGEGVGIFGMQVLAIQKFETPPPTSEAHGGDPPDLGLLRVDHFDLPAVTLKPSLDMREGQAVAFAGFPLGHELFDLDGVGRLTQVGPTLRRGIVAAVLPSPPARSAKGFLIDSFLQGGSSGSPVFESATGDVIGVIYGGVLDGSKTFSAGLTYAVPSSVLIDALQGVDPLPASPDALSYPDEVRAMKGRAQRPA